MVCHIEVRVAIGHSRVSSSVAGIELRRSSKHAPCQLEVMFCASVQKVSTAQVVSVRVNVFGRNMPDPLPLLRQQLDLELFYNCVRDFVLDPEDVDQIAIETFGPKMVSAFAL